MVLNIQEYELAVFPYVLHSCRHFVIAMEDRLLKFGINYEIPRGISSNLGGTLQYLFLEVHIDKSHGFFLLF